MARWRVRGNRRGSFAAKRALYSVFGVAYGHGSQRKMGTRASLGGHHVFSMNSVLLWRPRFSQGKLLPCFLFCMLSGAFFFIFLTRRMWWWWWWFDMWSSSTLAGLRLDSQSWQGSRRNTVAASLGVEPKCGVSNVKMQRQWIKAMVRINYPVP